MPGKFWQVIQTKALAASIPIRWSDSVSSVTQSLGSFKFTLVGDNITIGDVQLYNARTNTTTGRVRLMFSEHDNYFQFSMLNCDDSTGQMEGPAIRFSYNDGIRLLWRSWDASYVNQGTVKFQ